MISTTQADDLREKAVGAMKAAVANVIRDHQRTGRPLAVWRNGKVVMLPPNEAATVHEEGGEYDTEPASEK